MTKVPEPEYFPCPVCKGRLEYVITTDTLTCRDCKKEFELVEVMEPQ